MTKEAKRERYVDRTVKRDGTSVFFMPIGDAPATTSTARNIKE